MIEQSHFDELVNELVEASMLYYQSETTSPLTDDEYDLKLEYLEQLVDEQPELRTSIFTNLVEIVAGGTQSARADVKLKTPMLSLNKAKDEESLRRFLNKTVSYGANQLGWQLEAKLDGIALSVRYKNGRLSQIITRSSGTVGTNVTQILFPPPQPSEEEESLGLLKPKKDYNGQDIAYKIVGLPTAIRLKTSTQTEEQAQGIPDELELRGEIFMTRHQFDANNKQRQKSAELNLNKSQQTDNSLQSTEKKRAAVKKLHYSNPRNATAGVLNNDDLGYSAELTFLVYSIVDQANTAEESAVTIENLSHYGFTTVLSVTQQILGHTKSYTSIEQVIADVKKYGKLIVRDNLVGKFINLSIGEILTDGIVIKCVDDANITQAMGFTEHHPNSQIAYKFHSQDDWAMTTVEDIAINVGRTGRLSLRARVVPVFLYGSKIQYATLHNFDWLRERDVRIGSKIALIKAKDIIPYVSAVLDNPTGTMPFPPVDNCPICEVQLDKRTLLWRCPNDNCSSRGNLALKLAVSRDYFDIEFLSVQTLQALEQAELVVDIADLFKLTIADLVNLPTGEVYKTSTKTHEIGDPVLLGEKTAIKIYQSIQQAKSVGLAKVLASLNILGLGKRIAKNLAKHYGDIDAIMVASIDQLQEVELIKNIKAKTIHDGLIMRSQLIEKLRSAGVVLSSNNDESNSNQLKLAGETVVISGAVPKHNRQEAQDLVERNGGVTTTSVSKNTTLVVADSNSTSNKVTKAKQLGVKIITPDELLKLLEVSDKEVE